jgi:hypothetical protein
MDEEQRQRLTRVVERLQAALDRGVQHFDRQGKRLGSVATILEAWLRDGGLTIKDPRNDELIKTWIHQAKGPGIDGQSNP